MIFRPPPDSGVLADLVRRRSLPLAPIHEDGFAAAFDRFGDARVVLLGEATHGSREFYDARAAITRRLIDRHGFRIVAVEGDWPDVAELDRFARNRGVWGQKDSFPNFPRWMWRNAEFAAFVRSLRAWNLERPPADRAELRGMDVYSLSQSRRAVLDYLDRVDPQAADEARLPHPLSGSAPGLRRGGAPGDGRLRGRRRDPAGQPASPSSRLQPAGRRGLSGRRAERPRRAGGGGLLPRHVPGLGRELEPARQPHVRDPRPSA